jgi:alanine racemase
MEVPMLPRRKFLAVTASALGAAATTVAAPSRKVRSSRAVERRPDEASFDPWVEIEADSIRNNVREIYRFTKGCRLLAVTKNNANGIGLREIGPILDDMDEVFGLAVVRVDEALALREVGVKKPVVMMALVSDAEAEELVARDVRLSPFTDDAGRQLAHLAECLGRPIPVHLYIDTGMHRVGMPYYRALPWIEDLAHGEAVEIEGTSVD